MEALAWRAAGWRVESVDQSHGIVVFVPSTESGPKHNARAAPTVRPSTYIDAVTVGRGGRVVLRLFVECAAASGVAPGSQEFSGRDADATGGGQARGVDAMLDPVHRPWLDADPWRWMDQDTPADPTVYVPCTVHLTLSNEPDPVSGQVMSCTLREWKFRTNPVLRSPRPEQIVAGRIEVRPVPDDWFALRARYPWTYRPWRAYEARTHVQVRGADEMAVGLRG
ncbi:hypothetical protein Ari01nite_95980 [Paractinoplanes rishiriensis]|uniref:Uncharacterized protein n=1 Tax=Paractinoplanes rishiriensis TaxID=1050105 RepID=A0A919K8T4_9ACTN|nr:hypothetical protein [Actinoplanes rishiriensis]GIF02134.1 hypothetical protein Ari01nite_95980 [Actinoplanes rishiriensis]